MLKRLFLTIATFLLLSNPCFAVDMGNLDTVYNHYTNNFDFIWSVDGSGTATGIVGVLDPYFLRLDASNDPITGDITINANSATAFVVEQDGVKDNTLVVDTTNGRVGIGRVPLTESFEVQDGFDLFHTATEADDHAFEIDLDAAGFGDVKALDIDYITGAISAGEDEGIILINIDETLSTGGDIFALEVLATEGSAGVYGLKAGVGVGPIHQDSGTFANPTTGTDNTPSTDVPAMIDGSTGTTTAIFENDNEYIIIGAAAAFEELEFILTTSASVNIKPTFWYSIAGSGQFTQFTPVDGTNGFKNTGVVAWDASDLTSHTTNDDTGTYDIKVTRTKNNLTTSPILGYAKSASTTEYIWDKNGDVNINTLTSDVATGTAPLVVASTTEVPNLNAGRIGGTEITDGPSPGEYLTADSSIAASWKPQLTTENWSTTLGAGRQSNGNNPLLTTTDHLEFRDANNYFYSAATDDTQFIINSGGTFSVGDASNRTSIDSDGNLTTQCFILTKCLQVPIVAKTATYTATDSDFFIIMVTSGGDRTLNLPDVGSIDGRVYKVIKSSASNTLTIDPFSTDLIDGVSTKAITTNLHCIEITSFNSNWFTTADNQ